ncbi:MFS transporter [Streptomyces sp. NPDC059740]|uniref:MFS transporter n=1 Tax=Streptomyces sp. NPDC059740 TaxID=3346926 RepID=UPI00364DEA1B
MTPTHRPTTPPTDRAGGTGEEASPLRSPTLWALCLGYFMVILDSTIVNVALPALRKDLGAGLAAQQWVVDAYLVVLAAGLLCCGACADRFGPRRVFQSGLALFVLASLACGLAPDTTSLVAARVAQGVGAALALPSSLALLRVSYQERSARARAVGVWGAIAGIAAATGPLLGGLLVSAAGWRLVFFVNVPVGLVAMALTARRVRAVPGRPHRLDPAGQVTSLLALAALALAMIEGGRTGVSRPVVLAAAVFVLASLGFFLAERRVRVPMIPPHLFADRTLSGATAVGLLINLGFYGELFVLNLYLQQVRGDSALLAGLALLPQMGVAVLGSALSGRFTARTGGPRATMLAGLLVGGAGLLGLTAVGPHTPYPVLVVPLLAAGFGMSFTMPAATTAVTESAPAALAGLASGVINAARQAGSVIGVALLGALAGSGGTGMAGVRTALAASGVAFLAGAAVTARRVERTGRGATVNG